MSSTHKRNRTLPFAQRRLTCSVLGGLAAVLLAAQSPSASRAAGDTPNRVIHADPAGVRGPMNRMHNFCVGAGRANEGLRADWQRQLRKVREDCGFRYIRFHGLFCDDMGVYFED